MAQETLGSRIKALRTGKGLTLEQLAEKSGSAKSYIWELENRNTQNPSAEKLAKIAVVLEVTTDYLLGGNVEDVAHAVDQAFFRQYSSLPEETRRTIREMAKVISKKD